MKSKDHKERERERKSGRKTRPTSDMREGKTRKKKTLR